MTLNQLEILNAIAKTGSLSKAAKELNLSQPSITIQLRKLETELGTRLMDRLGVGVKPTQTGETLIRYAQEILKLVEDAKNSIAEYKAMSRGKIRIGASTIPGFSLLPQFVADFKERHPELEISMQVDNTDEIVALLERREVDIAIVGHLDEFEERFAAKPLYREKFALIMSPRSQLVKESRITLDMIRHQNFITNEPGSHHYRLIQKVFHAKGIEPRIIMSIKSLEGIVRAVAANLGISFVSQSVIKPFLQAGVIVMREVPEMEIIGQYDLVRLKDKYLCSSVIGFINEIENYVADQYVYRSDDQNYVQYAK